MTRKRSAPLALLVVGLLAALFAGLRQHSVNEDTERDRLDAVANRVLIQLKSRMQIYQYQVRAARGAIIGAGGFLVSRERFHAYSRSRDLKGEFPGALDEGFVRRVAAVEEAAALRAPASSPGPAEVGAAGPLDPAALTLFKRYLREQDLEAISIFSKLSPAIEHRIGSAKHLQLGAALDSLDFAAAADLVVGLSADA